MELVTTVVNHTASQTLDLQVRGRAPSGLLNPYPVGQIILLSYKKPLIIFVGNQTRKGAVIKTTMKSKG